MTRRLMGALVEHMIKHITASVPGQLAGTGNLPATERVALEHETATEVWRDAGSANINVDPGKPITESHRLTGVRLTLNENMVQMEFMAPGYQRWMQLNRADAHHILTAMAGRCIAANWNLPGWPTWLYDNATI